MKKILVLFNGIDYPAHQIAYGIELAKTDQALLQAVVMRPVSLANTVSYPFPNDLALAQPPLVTYEDTRENTELIKANLKLFADECKEAGVKSVAQPDTLSIDELIEQTAFSDLVLAGAKISFGDYSLEELLADTHCPVLIVTEKAKLPSKAILCYDEGFSSMFAIRHYSYLFPEWKSLPTQVVSINPKGDKGVKYSPYIDSWLQQHFIDCQNTVLEGNLQRELIGTIGKDEHCIVVMGAYGRSAVSRLFHRSLANVVFEETNAAVFVIHE